MALTINTNMSSLIVQKNLNAATSMLNKSIERMTTGYKINHAADNAAGYSIATTWKTQLGSLDVASDNASTGADMLTTLEDTYSLITSHLQRVRDLTEQAANSDAASRIALDASLFQNGHVSALFKTFGGVGGATVAEVAKLCSGYDGKQITGGQNEMLNKIDAVISEISARTTTLGAAQNRIESAVESINVQSENITSSLSTLRDADVAEESSNYIKAQILQQASATLLATANQTPSIALNLL